MLPVCGGPMLCGWGQVPAPASSWAVLRVLQGGAWSPPTLRGRAGAGSSSRRNVSGASGTFNRLTCHACLRVCSALSDSLRPHGLYVAHQSPLSIEISRQDYWSRLPFPSPGDLPHPGMESPSLMSPALAGGCVGSPNTQLPQHSPGPTLCLAW